jgi:hypothetical protein
MTAAEFKKKWSRYPDKESAAYKSISTYEPIKNLWNE